MIPVIENTVCQMAFLEDIRDYDYLPYLLHFCPFFDLLEKYRAERNPAMPLRGSVKKFKHSLIFPPY